MKSAGYEQHCRPLPEGIKLLVNLLFQFEACRNWFNEVNGILSAVQFIHHRADLYYNLKIVFICTANSTQLGNIIHDSGLCKDLLNVYFKF